MRLGLREVNARKQAVDSLILGINVAMDHHEWVSLGNAADRVYEG